MSALSEAITTGRYDLAAHILVLAAARVLRNGNLKHGCKKDKKLLLVSSR
jgi:hypothetical protein